MTTLEASVRHLISLYVAESIPIEELSDALPDGWELDEAGEPDVKRLVLQTIGRIADYEREALTEDQLRKLLDPETVWRSERVFAALSPPPPRGPQASTEVRAGAGTRFVTNCVWPAPDIPGNTDRSI